MKKIKMFFNGVKKEVKKVRWPNRKHMLKFSIATIFSVVFFGIFYYVIDLLIALVRTVLN